MHDCWLKQYCRSLPQPTHQLNQYAEEYHKNILPTNQAPISPTRNGIIQYS